MTKVVALTHGKTRASYSCTIRTQKDKEKKKPIIVKVALLWTFSFECWRILLQQDGKVASSRGREDSVFALRGFGNCEKWENESE